MRIRTSPAFSGSYARRSLLPALLAAGTVLIPAAQATFPASVNGPIVFVNCDVDGDGEIYRVKPDGSGLKRLTSDYEPEQLEYPAISPDGNRVAFGDQSDGGIYLMSIDGGEPVLLVSGTTGTDPAWTPDGDSLVFGCAGGLCLVPATGGSASPPITGTAAGDDLPDVSPDGLTVAFHRAGNIFTVPIAGGGTLQVTDCSAINGCNMPSYSPDGTSIALERHDTVPGECIAVVPSAPGSPVVPSCLPSSPLAEDENPSFSPNGLEIVADAGDGHLARIDATGGTGREVFKVSSLAHACDPSWGRAVEKNSPQAFCGKVYFDARRKAEGKIARLSLRFFKVSPDCNTVTGLPAMQNDLDKFDVAIDKIIEQANTAIEKRGGVEQCDSGLQELLAGGANNEMERGDLLQGSNSGAEYLEVYVEQTCNMIWDTG